MDELIALVNDDRLAWADAPVLLVAAAVWWYWAAVLTLSRLRRRWTGRQGALRPRTPADRWLMRGWAVVILLWNLLPALALHKAQAPLGPFVSAYDMPLLAVRWAGAIGAVLCLLATVCCWVEMGRDWSVAIVEKNEDQQLVTTGLFRFVRHPIYALSVAMVLLTAVACMSWPMALVALLHVTLMNIKARNEEQALIGVFGEQYRAYMQRTGRFVPRLF